ncbi:ATP-binding cassette domain-containing protein [Paraburkholderia monticola]|uniref:ATP-binding cassette domain-containing protein n=1 Tax=Paraburkholderia monticola TaxID=1399968 RepID=UPI001F4CBCCA|nr:ATP-binding cassette domain-containing protein [Paraburkholderia monticola]
MSGIERSYGGRKGLDGVSKTSERGEIVALIGHNGVGKTTQMCALIGLVQLRGRLFSSGRLLSSNRSKSAVPTDGYSDVTDADHSGR